MLLKVGELAKRTGLTVRTLHHYDDIGLLTPSGRSEGGYRLYGREDISRLYRIQALRRLDVSLGEIRDLLANHAHSFSDLVDQQITTLDERIHDAQRMRAQLAALKSDTSRAAGPRIEEGLAAFELLVSGTKYFTEDELLQLRAGRVFMATHEPERMALVASLRRLLDQGVPAESTEAGALAARWMAHLLDQVMGDAGLLIKLYAMQRGEPAIQALTGVDEAGLDYLNRAMACGRLQAYAAHCSPDEFALLRRHYLADLSAWPVLIERIRNLMQAGQPPASAPARALVQQWSALWHTKTGGHDTLRLKLEAAVRLDPKLRFGTGIDLPLLDYVDAARQTAL